MRRFVMMLLGVFLKTTLERIRWEKKSEEFLPKLNFPYRENRFKERDLIRQIS